MGFVLPKRVSDEIWHRPLKLKRVGQATWAYNRVVLEFKRRFLLTEYD